MRRPITAHEQTRSIWLSTARVAWIALAVLTLALFVSSVLYALLRPQVRPDLAVSMDSLTVPFTIRDPGDLPRVLSSLQLSARAYAWYALGFKIVQAFAFGIVAWATCFGAASRPNWLSSKGTIRR